MSSTILVIEDHDEIRENLCEILEISGYAVVSASNGIEGVKKARTFKPDLILCDILMPELDGYGVLRIVSKDPKTSFIPFIFLTAKTEVEDMRRGMTLGADDYIMKPFDDAQLLDAIEIRLKKYRQKTPIASSNLSGPLLWNMERSKAVTKELFIHEEKRIIRDKDSVYHEGQYCREVFYLVSGKLKVSKINQMGKDLISYILTPGSIFGYYPIFQNNIYQGQCVGLETSELRCLGKDKFLQKIRSNRDVFYLLLSDQIRRTSFLENKMLDHAYNSVRGKVAHTLVYLYELYQKDGVAEIPLRREDIAAIAGIAKETLIRTLTAFKEEGVIDTKVTNIIIHAAEPLNEMIY